MSLGSGAGARKSGTWSRQRAELLRKDVLLPVFLDPENGYEIF
jgi:hypothetical protein